jgi:DNA-binding NtrC family response regulator
MQELRATIAKIAPTSLPVLIEGPTGAGKELVAGALHALSARPGALVAFNVCAIADSMFEDAFFGHVKGSFSGALSDRAGYLMEAHQGTLFLDEISRLGVESQAKLLRAIELGEFRPVGGRHNQRSQFRLISATNEHLSSIAEAGRFRVDLLHRLRGFTIRVPSLRSRADDIRLLARHFSAEAESDIGHSIELADAALDLLHRHEWPGNVRELRHVVQCAIAIRGHPRVVAIADVEAALMNLSAFKTSPSDDCASIRELVDTMEAHDWKVVRVAEALGVDRTTIWRRLQRFGINRRSRGGFNADASPNIRSSLSDHPTVGTA